MRKTIGYIMIAFLCLGFMQVVNAGETEQVKGTNVLAVYNRQAGMLSNVTNPVDGSVTRMFGQYKDSIVRDDKGIITVLTKFIYDAANKLSAIWDLVNAVITYFDVNENQTITASEFANKDDVARLLAIYKNNPIDVAGELVRKEITNGNGIVGINSVMTYTSKGFKDKEYYYALAAKGTTIGSAALDADKVIETGYTQYVDGLPKYRYELYTRSYGGKPIDAQAFNNLTEDQKKEVTWTKAGAPVKVAEYFYTGKTLNRIDYFNSKGEVYRQDLFKNGRIEKTVDAKGNTLVAYVYDGARLVRVDDYTDLTGAAAGKVTSRTYMDKFGRQSYTEDNEGNVIGRWFYNDTGKNIEVTVDDPDAVAELKKLDKDTDNIRIVDGKAYLTMRAGQTIKKVDLPDTGGTVSNVTYFDQTNQALITVQVKMTGLEVQGVMRPRDPVATGLLKINESGQLVMIVDVSTMWDPSGKVSKEELKKLYDPDGDGKAEVVIQTLDPAKLAATQAGMWWNQKRTVDAKDIENKDLSKKLLQDGMLEKVVTLFWNFATKNSLGMLVVFVESYY